MTLRPLGGRRRTAAECWHYTAAACCSGQPISLHARSHLAGTLAASPIKSHEMLTPANVGGDTALPACRGDDAAVVPDPTRRSSEPEREMSTPPSDETLMACEAAPAADLQRFKLP